MPTKYEGTFVLQRNYSCDGTQEPCNARFLLSVANSNLRGQSDLEKAQVLQWLGFADSEILPASHTWVFPCLGIMQYNKQVRNVV
jgi:elongation factor 1-gamma